MGRSSELFIKMQQYEIQRLKDVPEYLIKEIQNANNTRNTRKLQRSKR